MKNKIFVLVLILTLISTFAVISISQAKTIPEWEEEIIADQMSIEEMVKTFTNKELSAWDMGKRFAWDYEPLQHLNDDSFWMVKIYRPTEKYHIKEIENNVFEINLFLKYKSDIYKQGIMIDFQTLYVEKISKVKWVILDYE